MTGTARRLISDPLLRAQLVEVVSQLRAAQKRAKQARSHKLRNALFVLGGVGMVVGAGPVVRPRVRSRIGRRRLGWAPAGSSFAARQAMVAEEIEVAVPVSTAYNQWTQFEEFARFMDGVDEVRQLDNTLLRWRATVAGKRAEWDAKIIEQEPDRLIAWESTNGKHTRGTVTFDEAGSGRSRIRLQMVYATDGVGEKVGAAIGLDNRRVRGDLERFRQLIENRRVESGGWRGQINDGVETSGNTPSD